LGAFAGFGVHVLLVQKSLMRLRGTHFEPKVQRPANTAFWWGFFVQNESGAPTAGFSDDRYDDGIDFEFTIKLKQTRSGAIPAYPVFFPAR